MTDQLVSFETAKLAKEKGFKDMQCISRYDGEELVSEEVDRASSATQSLLQKWLREEHKIHVFIGYRPNVQKWDSQAYSLLVNGKEYVKIMKAFNRDIKYDTYEEALEAGLQEALKLIKT